MRRLSTLCLLAATAVVVPAGARAAHVHSTLTGTVSDAQGWCCGDFGRVRGVGTVPGLGRVSFVADWQSGCEPDHGPLSPDPECFTDEQLVLTKKNGATLTLSGGLERRRRSVRPRGTSRAVERHRRHGPLRISLWQRDRQLYTPTRLGDADRDCCADRNPFTVDAALRSSCAPSSHGCSGGRHRSVDRACRPERPTRSFAPPLREGVAAAQRCKQRE